MLIAYAGETAAAAPPLIGRGATTVVGEAGMPRGEVRC